jgi:hypothetical protein
MQISQWREGDMLQDMFLDDGIILIFSRVSGYVTNNNGFWIL